MKAETNTLAIWALQEQRDKVWTAARYNSEATRQSLEAEIDSFDAAIADLEAGQAAPPSVAMPRPDRIASLEIVMSGLDDYWAIQPEVQGHIANVREWIDELKRRPEPVAMSSEDMMLQKEREDWKDYLDSLRQQRPAP